MKEKVREYYNQLFDQQPLRHFDSLSKEEKKCIEQTFGFAVWYCDQELQKAKFLFVEKYLCKN